MRNDDEFVRSEWGWMEGKKVATVRPLTDDELGALYWFRSASAVPTLVEFTDGTAFVPSCDPEGNGAGWMLSFR